MQSPPPYLVSGLLPSRGPASAKRLDLSLLSQPGQQQPDQIHTPAPSTLSKGYSKAIEKLFKGSSKALQRLFKGSSKALQRLFRSSPKAIQDRPQTCARLLCRSSQSSLTSGCPKPRLHGSADIRLPLTNVRRIARWRGWSWDWFAYSNGIRALLLLNHCSKLCNSGLMDLENARLRAPQK
jgi:hypothetical protein